MIDKKPYSVWGLMIKYVAHCFLQMIVLSVTMGALADIWRREYELIQIIFISKIY